MSIIRYQLDDLGIEHSQYFPGYGKGSFGESACGIGENPREALDDCLDQIAQQGFDTEALERDILASFPAFCNDIANDSAGVVEHLRRENPSEWFDDDSGEFVGDDCELYYHIGIRFDGVPNLDALERDELEAFAGASIDDCGLIDGEQLALLREYAIYKAHAVACRSQGNIARALEYESDCERLYSKLSAPVRW